MRKISIYALLLVLTLAMMTGCGSMDSNGSNGGNGNNNQTNQSTTLPSRPNATQSTTTATEATTTPTTGTVEPTDTTDGNAETPMDRQDGGNGNSFASPGNGNPSTGDPMGRARPFRRAK